MPGSDRVHPYIPNSVPAVKARMLAEIGVDDIEALYEDIPEELRFRGELNIPEGITSEMELMRHVEHVLSKNQTCRENISFLGGGCHQHRRDEFAVSLGHVGTGPLDRMRRVD